MYVKQKQKIAEETYILRIHAPEIAKITHPGQYVSLQRDSSSKKFAMFVTETDKDTVGIMATQDGAFSELIDLKKGDSLHSFCGPLGKSFQMNEYGSVVIVAEGHRIGPAFFFGKSLKKAGNRVYFIGRYKNKKSRFWESKMSRSFDKWCLLNKKEEPHDSMIKELNTLLRKKNIRLTIGLCDAQTMQSIAHVTQLRSSCYTSFLDCVVDGPGMCASCRIEVSNDMRFPCVDGPLLNAHHVNWESVKSCCRRASELTTTNDSVNQVSILR